MGAIMVTVFGVISAGLIGGLSVLIAVTGFPIWDVLFWGIVLPVAAAVFVAAVAAVSR